MATGISAARANAAIDAVVALGTWIKFHTANPGSAGTTAAATEVTRQQATFASASGGSASTTTDLTWISVAGTETYTHFSMWTASSGGTFLWSGTVSGPAVTAGDTFSLLAGNIILSMTVAA